MPKFELRDKTVAVEEAEMWLRPLPSPEAIQSDIKNYGVSAGNRLKRGSIVPTVRMLPFDEIRAIASNTQPFLGDLVKARDTQDEQRENFSLRRQAGFIKEVMGLVKEEEDTDVEAKRFISFLPYWKGMKIATTTVDADKELYAGITWEIIVPVMRGVFELEEETRLRFSGQKNMYEKPLRVAQAALAIVSSGSLPNPIEAKEATEFFSQQVIHGESLFQLIYEQIEVEEQAATPMVQGELPLVVNEIASPGKTLAEIENEERENYMSRFLLEEINIDNDPEEEALRVMDEFKRWSEREIEKKIGLARVDARKILSPINWSMMTRYAELKYGEANVKAKKQPDKEAINTVDHWGKILRVAQRVFSIIYQQLDD